MAKYYIPSERKHICIEVKQLFESVSNEKKDFLAFSYGLALQDDEYFHVDGQFACAKCYFERFTPYVLIKKDIKSVGFSFGAVKYNLKTQYDDARKALRSLLGLKDKITFDMLSSNQEDIIKRFKEELKDFIAAEKVVNNTRMAFYSLFDEQFAPFWFVINENNRLIFKYKTIAPVSFEKEGTIIEIEKNKTAFNDAVYRAKAIINSQEMYDLIRREETYKSMMDLVEMTEGIIETEKPYVIGSTMFYELIKGTMPVSIEIRNNDGILTIVPKIGKKEKGYFSFDDDGMMKAFEVLQYGKIISKDESSKEKKVEVKKVKQIVIEPEVEKISSDGKNFLDMWKNLPIAPTKEELQLVFDFCDEVPDKDFEDLEIKTAYEKLSNHPLLNPPTKTDILINIVSTRSIFVREGYLKFFKDNEFTSEIIDKMRSLSMKDLFVFFKSRRLVYIDGFLKIRISNTRKERIVFVTGDKIGKNANDIYIYEFNEHHDFKHLKDSDPFDAKYEMLCKNVKLDENQESLAESFHIPYKPLICTGCAGSGKTLISVKMYQNIVEEVYSGGNVSEIELIYLTYNRYTVNSVRPLLKEKVNTVNAKTIEEFFTDIIGKDALSGKTLVDENDFYKWWNKDQLNQISDFKKKNALLDYKKNNPARYAYTFFRGFFKGSLYKMQITFAVSYLSKIQFTDLIKTKNEPLKDDDISNLYALFELYQNDLVRRNCIDDNDLARLVSMKVANKVATQYERIIVDEVQDLTEVQLDAIIKASSDKRKLYFFGDQNQSINPTLFDISTIQRCLEANLITEVVKPYKMNKSYRVGPLLAEYINHLTKIINDKIGASGAPLETSALTGSESRWGYKVQNKDNADVILEQALRDAKTIIIVPDESTIQDLAKRFGDDVKDRVITIYDSKGLEWDQVILYDMLSFNNEKFEEILNGDAYNSTLHRMIFNQYYVGCTRAHIFFIVIESNISKLVEETILGTLVNAPLDIISADNSSESWFLEGERLFKLQEYKLAKNAFIRAKDEKSLKLVDVCNWMLEEKYSLEKANYCKTNGLYNEARIMYLKLGDSRKERLMEAYLGASLSDLEIKDLLNNMQLSSQDMEILNKNCFFNKKMNSIQCRINDLLKNMEEK